MDKITGRPNSIEDWLVSHKSNQWFGFENINGDDSNKTYDNLIIHDGSEKPTEQECIDGLAQLQADFDAQDYARKRKVAYPSIQDLVVALYDTEDKAAIDTKRAEIKLKYPKPVV